MLETVVCTISDEGTPRKNELVKDTMERLHSMAHRSNGRIKVIGAHLGDDDPEMGLMFENHFPGIIRIPTILEGSFVQRARRGMQALFSEAKRRVAYELDEHDPQSVLYMEGDKPEFVQNIGEVVQPVLDGRFEVTVATRSAQGLEAFPKTQMFWEGRANREIAKITGREIDLMYGPRAWNPQCANYFAGSQRNDFGALTYSVVRAMLEERKVIGVEVLGFPQDGYMQKYPSIVRIPLMHFVYRALQNGPHIKAAKQAEKDANRG